MGARTGEGDLPPRKVYTRAVVGDIGVWLGKAQEGWVVGRVERVTKGGGRVMELRTFQGVVKVTPKDRIFVAPARYFSTDPGIPEAPFPSADHARAYLENHRK